MQLIYFFLNFNLFLFFRVVDRLNKYIQRTFLYHKREVKQKQIWNVNIAQTVIKMMILTLQRLQKSTVKGY